MKKIISLGLVGMLFGLTSCSNPMSGIDASLTVDDVQDSNDPNSCVKIYLTNMAREVKFHYSEGPSQVDESKPGTLESEFFSYQLINRNTFKEVQTGTINGPGAVSYGQTVSFTLPYNTIDIKNLDPYFSGELNVKIMQTYVGIRDVDYSTRYRTEFKQVNCGRIIFATLQNKSLSNGDVYDGHNNYNIDIVLNEAEIEGRSASERSLNMARYANVIDKEILGHSARSMSREIDPVVLSRGVVTNNYEETVSKTLNGILARAQVNGNKDANLPVSLRKALTKHILNSIEVAKKFNK